MSAILLAIVLIFSGILLISFILLITDRRQKFRTSSTDETLSYGDCYRMCKGNSGDVSAGCIGLCIYGWP